MHLRMVMFDLAGAGGVIWFLLDTDARHDAYMDRWMDE